MPHKHTRKPGGSSDAHFNLAPSTRAKPLPAYAGVTKVKSQQDGGKQGQKRKRKCTGTADYKEDDTPRAFARLMQFHTTGKRLSGLDDDAGSHKAKKRKTKAAQDVSAAKTEAATTVKTAAPATVPELPKILPGERLADYAARVDQALPVGNLIRKGKGPKIEGLKERQTKTERRLKKMYASWREDEARRKEKLEEAQELEEEAEEEKRAMYGEDYKLPESSSKKRRVVGEVAGEDEEGDPWAVLKERRAEKEEASNQSEVVKGRRKGGLKGLHDVVQAPPTIKVVPKEKFKVRNGAKVDVANIPTAAGSLKRREELSDARRDVIERYRAMMKGKGGL